MVALTVIHVQVRKRMDLNSYIKRRIFSNTELYSYFAVLSIIDIYANHKELILKLQSCIG